MKEFFKDFRFPGRKAVVILLTVVVVAGFVLSVAPLEADGLDRALKALVLLFDLIALYIIFWIVRKGPSRQGAQVLLLLVALIAGFTMMAFL